MLITQQADVVWQVGFCSPQTEQALSQSCAPACLNAQSNLPGDSSPIALYLQIEVHVHTTRMNRFAKRQANIFPLLFQLFQICKEACQEPGPILCRGQVKPMTMRKG